MEPDKRLLSAKEAAVYLGLSHRTIWHWARIKHITCVRIGRRVFFDREYLDKVIEHLTEHEE